jgi:hypothetical protein
LRGYSRSLQNNKTIELLAALRFFLFPLFGEHLRRVLSDFVQLSDVPVAPIVYHFLAPACLFQMRLPNRCRTHRDAGAWQLFEVRATANRTDGDSRVQHQKLKFLPAAAALVIIDRHIVVYVNRKGHRRCNKPADCEEDWAQSRGLRDLQCFSAWRRQCAIAFREHVNSAGRERTRETFIPGAPSP